MKRVMMLVLPTDWSPKKTSLYFARAETGAIIYLIFSGICIIVDQPNRREEEIYRSGYVLFNILCLWLVMEQRRRRKRSPILVFDLLLTGRVGLEFWLFGSSRVFTEMKKKKTRRAKYCLRHKHFIPEGIYYFSCDFLTSEILLGQNYFEYITIFSESVVIYNFKILFMFVCHGLRS